MPALANSTTTVFAILPILSLTGLVIPYTRALLSNSVLPDMQAQMFAGLSGIESIGTLLSPLFSLGYSLTVGTFGGAMFFVMSGLTGLSALIIFYIRSRELIATEQYGPLDDSESDMKEPIIGTHQCPPEEDAHQTYCRAYSIASGATYGDRQMSVSIAL